MENDSLNKEEFYNLTSQINLISNLLKLITSSDELKRIFSNEMNEYF